MAFNSLIHSFVYLKCRLLLIVPYQVAPSPGKHRVKRIEIGPLMPQFYSLFHCPTLAYPSMCHTLAYVGPKLGKRGGLVSDKQTAIKTC